MKRLNGKHVYNGFWSRSTHLNQSHLPKHVTRRTMFSKEHTCGRQIMHMDAYARYRCKRLSDCIYSTYLYMYICQPYARSNEKYSVSRVICYGRCDWFDWVNIIFFVNMTNRVVEMVQMVYLLQTKLSKSVQCIVEM